MALTPVTSPMEQCHRQFYHNLCKNSQKRGANPHVTIWFTWILGMFLSFQSEKVYNYVIRFGNKSGRSDRYLWLNLAKN